MKSTSLIDKIGSLVFDQAPFLIAVIDQKNQIVISNALFAETFGKSKGAFCYAIYKGLDQPCENCATVKVFDCATNQVSEEQGITKHGKQILYRVHTFPVLGNKGEVEYALQMCLDTTRLVELEHGFEQAERLATVGLTAAGLAHTIKNILAGLEGGTYVMDSGLDQKEWDRVEGGWKMVRKYIEQTTSLVQNLLTYAKPKKPQRQKVDPEALINDVVQLFEEKANLSAITIISRTEGKMHSLLLDKEAMHACLSNLVSNAIDACTWDPNLEKTHQIFVTARPVPTGGVIMEVQDNGPGISNENQPKILTAFFTTKGIRGTGLGLLLTKKTVQEHGGKIDFVSTPGKGSTFRIKLPPMKTS